jgi:predicted phage terminase large subunit-like protein
VSLFYKPAATEADNDIKDPIFPERFTIDALKALRAQSPEMFASQYMLNPRHNSRDRFNRDDFKFYTKDELARAGIGFKVMYTDPARSTTKYSDYTACAVIGVGYNRRIYLLDGFRERLTSDEMAGKLASLYDRWRPNVCHAEKNGLEQFLKDSMKLHGFEKFTGVTSHGEKVDRIRSIHGYVRRGMIWLSSEPQWRTTPEGQRYDLVHEFLKEAIGFPHGEHDDFLDALQGALRACKVTIKERGQSEEEETRLAMIARKILPRRPDKPKADPVFGRYGSNW